MGIGTGALVIGGIASAGIGAAGSIASANTQAGAAKNAQELQAQEAQNALNFQEQEFGTEQANQAPFLKAGTGAVDTLAGLLSKPGEGLLTPWDQTFTAPTAAQAAQFPGEQFQLQQGTEALDNSAAGAGALDTGATGAALQQYGQGLASTDYQNVYNDAFNGYLQNYNQFQQNQTNQYNRLAGLAGTGQVAAQTLGQQGQQAANNVGNINLTSGQQQGNDINLAGAANASGYAGATNAATGSINSTEQMLLLQQLLSGGGSGGGAGYFPGIGA